MMSYLPQLVFALRAAGIPFLGVDPGTGTVTYDPAATPAQIAAGNALVAKWTSPAAADVQQAQRGPAVALLAAIEQGGNPCLLRALCVCIVLQLNVLRERLTTQDAAVAAATSLANLQSRWAALASATPLPDITKAQVIAAIASAINAGSGDSSTS